MSCKDILISGNVQIVANDAVPTTLSNKVNVSPGPDFATVQLQALGDYEIASLSATSIIVNNVGFPFPSPVSIVGQFFTKETLGKTVILSFLPESIVGLSLIILLKKRCDC